jgi:hypothetical protein
LNFHAGSLLIQRLEGSRGGIFELWPPKAAFPERYRRRAGNAGTLVTMVFVWVLKSW